MPCQEDFRFIPPNRKREDLYTKFGVLNENFFACLHLETDVFVEKMFWSLRDHSLQVKLGLSQPLDNEIVYNKIPKVEDLRQLSYILDRDPLHRSLHPYSYQEK